MTSREKSVPPDRSDQPGSSIDKTTSLLGGIAQSLEEFAASIRSHAEQYELAEVENRKARDLFVGMVAHELRTPVSALRSRLELLAQEVISGEGKRMVEQLLESCDDLVQISSDLLDFQKIEAGFLTLHDAPFLPRMLLNRITEDQTAISETLNTHFDLRVEGVASNWRMGDRHRLLQILSNLLGNAQKYSGGGNVLLTADFRAAEAIVFTIKDNGPGLTAEEVSLMFHPYRQLSAGQSSAAVGTGLGLVVVQHLVDLMNGDISVDSAPGAGTSFRVSLPMPECASPNVPDAPRPTVHKELALDLSGKVLLHADDDKLQGDLLVELLRHTGVRLLRATSVEEALSILSRRRCDFLITDLYLNDGTGVEIITHLRRLQQTGRQADVRVLVTSAAIPEHVKETLAEMQVDEVCFKPLRRKALHEFLKHPPGSDDGRPKGKASSS